MNKIVLEKYAKLAVYSGVNVQKGQPLLINSSVDDAYFVRLCAKAAYERGASEVIVRWSDDTLSHLMYEYESTEALSDVPQWNIDMFQSYIDKGVAVLHIISPTPGLLADIDAAKVSAVTRSLNVARSNFRAYTMGNKGQWSIVAVPSTAWAKKVFPALDDDQAVEALWKAILKAVRVNETDDPIEAWDEHNAMLHAHNQLLNAYNFKSLHFKNNHGTDVVIGLVDNHIWAGGSEKSISGVVFNPNMPTEESFTMPSTVHVNGRITASKPLSYNGHLIDDFYIDFKDGAAVNWNAKTGNDILTMLLNTDEGSKRLGEIALISHQSPISQSGILFYNTLFDENASCHIALGKAYPMNVKGGTQMSLDELSAAGANDSLIHVDYMFGTEDMHIEGLTHEGQTVTVFENGNFVF